MKKLTFAIVFISLLLFGCANLNIGKLSIVSTKNIELSELTNCTISESKCKGIDKEHIIILIPTGVPEFDKAINNALDKIPGAIAMTDVQIKYKFWYIPYIYGQEYYEVEGTVLKRTAEKPEVISINTK